ncbi:Peptide deformylase [Streptomyces sp. RB5]|uniref:Peptide deformylase n=1 Tax=Streptomyces smaragdinus TaxID=2585196 RepID=A0A7K0CB61_9ACTN|nr:peptide deformylase [Streptomyces smaragdinus]MQY10690.1 Peptide deformylase [Streptomyces smaragdinus]
MSERRIPGAGGRVRDVRRFGSAVMHRPAAAVTEFGEPVERLVEDMFATMYAARGVGLAACQIGVGLRVFVYDCPDDEDVRHLGHVVNPRLVSTGGVRLRGPEGCLSLPGREAATERWDEAVVEGVDAAGEPVRVAGTGWFARCLQHECDHLDGTVFSDRLGPVRRRRVLR